MYLSSLYAFKDTVSVAGDTEDLVVDNSTDFASDVLDLVAANINNGGGELYLNLQCVQVSASLTADKDLEIKVEESSNGTDFTPWLSHKLSTDGTGFPIIAVGPVLKTPLKENLKRYLRVSSVVETGLGSNKTAKFKAFLSTS
jgi:hypothetical protein